MTLNVGPGILTAMAANHDHPLFDSTFGVNSDKTEWERCEGLHAVYAASAASGQWEVSVDRKNPPQAPVPPLPQPQPVVNVPSPSFWPAPRPVSILAIVIHSMDGTMAGCDARFLNKAEEVSAHFGVGLDGTVHRYVQDLDVAWSNGILSPGKPWAKLAGVNPSTDPNYYTVSIETEDNGSTTTPVSAVQLAAVTRLCRAWQAAYPTIRYLVAHNAITATACPGQRWTGGALATLAQTLSLQLVQ